MEERVVLITPQNQRKLRGGLSPYLVGVSTNTARPHDHRGGEGRSGLVTDATAQKALDS